VIAANIAAAGAGEHVSGAVMNCACGERFSLLELFRRLRDLCGADGVEPVFDEPRTGDVKHSLADIGLARELLGYEPEVRFDEGLRRTVAWYAAQAGDHSE